MPKGFSRVAATVTLAAVLSLSAAAAAQVVERNLPPELAPAAPHVTAPPLPAEADDRAIGPALVAVVALGPTDPVRTGSERGIDVAPHLRLSPADGRLALGRFLGRPLSRKLIAQVEAAVARVYRHKGFPFVSVTVPEQEVTSGVLQLRVIEFQAGQVKATGGVGTLDAYVEGRVRTRTGDAIDAGALSEDLDWLNRNPFRQVQATFAPGQGLGRTDLDLTVTEAKPWRVYGGYAQSGSAATGRDRWLLGGQAAGLPGIPDAIASYQFTGSPDAFGNDHPRYLSHAVRLGLPLLPRQAVELTFDHVESNQPIQDFVSRQLTDELTLGWRGAISNLVSPNLARLRGDLSVGVEARQADRRLLFGGVGVQRAELDVFQVYAGYGGSFADPLGSTSLNATLHVSPGGLNRRDGDAAYASFSSGRVQSAEYAYLGLQASRVTVLPRSFALSTELIGQYAGAALPDTEQTAIGAPSLVRGYSLDDGAFDTGVILRDELRTPALALLPAKLGAGDALQPGLFFDAGWAHERVTRRDQTALSVGLGADWRVGSSLQLGGDVACPLRHGAYTRSGDCRVEGRLTISR